MNDNSEADLNGSANILCKAIPGIFDGMQLPDFANVLIIKHPDFEKSKSLRRNQLSLPKEKEGISTAKARRLAKKSRRMAEKKISA